MPNLVSNSVTAQSKRVHPMPFGTQITKTGVAFSLWAPSAKSVDLCLYLQSNGSGEVRLRMDRHEDGFHRIETEKAKPGDLYQYAVVTDGELKVPDPASRFQPNDVHAPSQIVDPTEFQWHDQNWKGRAWHEAVIYELHVGTFTSDGTFKGVESKLEYLRDLGITAIELMPLADFPGRYNWGYDGVLQFAPDSSYGTPADLKRLIQRAHELGMMVLLDVVYNHFGPDGNYLYAYAREFFTHDHKTPWGDGINFDHAHNDVVRAFFINNALYWLNEYNFDGLRFDAVHAIRDDSQRKFLHELARTIRTHVDPSRQIHLILENDDNTASLLTDTFFTAQWNDDFHHVMHVLTTGESGGYYSDYTKEHSFADVVDHFERVLTQGFAYQGAKSQHREGQIRGEASEKLPPTAFVSFLQNHDQIGNRAFGDRLSSLVADDALRAALSVLLLSPQVPMLYMGEEWASKTPFCFFCDLSDDLKPSITEGRRNEFAKFPEFAKPENRERIPDPCSIKTRDLSVLNWNDLESTEHRPWWRFVKSLIVLRKQEVLPHFGRNRGWQASARKFAARGVEATWTMPDGFKLKMIGNFSNETVPADVDTNGMFFNTHAALPENNLQAWQVVWSLAK